MTVMLSTFGQLPTNFTVALLIPSSRIPGNRAHFRLSPFVMGPRWVVLKISKVLRLGNRTRQSTSFVIKSFGEWAKFKSTERGLQVAHREILFMDKRAHALDVGSDGRVEYQIYALSVQTIPSQSHRIPRNSLACRMTVGNIASLYVFPKKWKQHITQMQAGRG